MALDRFGCELLALLRDAGVPLTRFVMLGRQHLTASEPDLLAIPSLAPLARELDTLLAEGGGYAEPFLGRLGIREIDSIDCSGYEGCTRIHDLNLPVPAEWHERYDVVFDGGSLEHVFQFPTALASAMNLVAEGGYFLTGTPSNHYNGHGFYQFSAELFFRVFDAANGFSLPLIAFAEPRSGRLFRVDDPSTLKRRITFGGRGPMQLVVLARRDRILPIFQANPFQSDYSLVWSENSDRSEGRNVPRHPLRAFVPKSLLRKYDAWRAFRRRDAEAKIGVHEISSLSDGLRMLISG